MPTCSSSARALQVFPAGSNGEFNLPPELCCVLTHGEGCRLFDADGREFVDFSMGWGSSFPGHAHPAVVAAVQAAIADGASFATITERSLSLAEVICRLSPACEQVRFCTSGTEATMYALRLARAYTGRSKILKFEGAYHGAHDVGVCSLFPQQFHAFPKSESSSSGVAPRTDEHVLVAPFNDADAVEHVLKDHYDDLAAVIVEPLHRCIPPRDGFLTRLRDLCSPSGALLVFDEVVTGFRLAYGGAQEYYRVSPDIVAYGKALGGGLPIGAFGGRADIMDLCCEHRLGSPGYVWTASTLGGNPVSCAAALAALDVYQERDAYASMHRLGEYLRCGMREALQKHGVAGQIIGDGPLAQVIFTSAPVFDYRSAHRGDSGTARRLMLALFRRGIFLNPMGTKLYLSMAHREADCDLFLDRFATSLAESL